MKREEIRNYNPIGAQFRALANKVTKKMKNKPKLH
jgi:hypothetical protein